MNVSRHILVCEFTYFDSYIVNFKISRMPYISERTLLGRFVDSKKKLGTLDLEFQL
jgi:hypothetical protein